MSTPSSPILVTGATGRHGGLGGLLVRRLREAGREVRVLARKKDERTEPLVALGADVVVGDLQDRASLLHALDGVDLVYFAYPINQGVIPAAANFAAAVRQVGRSPRVVVMSMGPAVPDSPSHLGRAQWLAEEVLAWAGLDLLVLRVAALFHENLAVLHARSVRERGVFRNSFDETVLPWIAGVDAAELAVAALLHPERFSGAALEILPGSEAASHAEVARVLSAELGREVCFEGISAQAWREELEAQAASETDGVVNADMASHISALGAALRGASTVPVDPDRLTHLTGHTPRTLAEYISEQRDLFGPAIGASR
ncbi:NmrA family NAD(P)-binding protein [Streptomyces sp. NPDC001698]|uniref:NmrA family NAD(P)-binding protein n=1 Tax=Streptomyces sp. NPDC001698 TaxID=3364601 RepID=UPI0036B28B21